jgi:hypothetical protein
MYRGQYSWRGVGGRLAVQRPRLVRSWLAPAAPLAARRPALAVTEEAQQANGAPAPVNVVVHQPGAQGKEGFPHRRAFPVHESAGRWMDVGTAVCARRPN